VKKPIFKTD